MSQHDYDIANAAGAAVRADLNLALLAAVSQNSGATEPSATFAYQLWADTTSGYLKIRNAANNAWVTLFKLSDASFQDALFSITDDGDATKVVKFQASGITTGTTRTQTVPDASGTLAHKSGVASPGEVIVVALGDETTAITTGTAKVTFRMPFAMTLTAVRATLTAASSSGLPTFDINEAGATILSTKITIDVSEKTSTTAATAAVISDAALADDAEITIDIDTAGTGAAGAKVYLIGYRT